MSEEKKSISISSKNFTEISQKIKNSDNQFSSVDEYVDYVLNEILFENDKNELSDSEKEKVTEELKRVLETVQGDYERLLSQNSMIRETEESVRGREKVA